MFYALFVHCAMLPLIRALAARTGFQETEVWRTLKIPFRTRPPNATPISPPAPDSGPG
jgi:hypothetical protein